MGWKATTILRLALLWQLLAQVAAHDEADTC
jgi:hypothetical protein